MDPHGRSVTIEVMAPDETVLDGGRSATDSAGYAAILREAKQWPEPASAMKLAAGPGGRSPLGCSPTASM